MKSSLRNILFGLIVGSLLLGTAGYFLIKNTEKVVTEPAPSAPGETAQPEPLPVSTPQPEPPTVSLVSAPYFFSPVRITIPEGTTVRFNVTNFGKHTFTSSQLGVRIPLEQTHQSFSLTPTKTGVFEFYSTVNNDRARGMEGAIVVVPNS